jgi:hypothetical protein
MAVSRPSQQGFLDRHKKRVPLAGDRDNVNLTFSAPEIFLAGTEEVFRNGVLLDEGVDEDYTLGESAGPGTGYDTIILTPGAGLWPWEKLLANYVIPA